MNDHARRNTTTFSQVLGTTLGVIGYGDIGQAAAVKAKAMGMKVIAQRRRPELSSGDDVADEVFGPGQASLLALLLLSSVSVGVGISRADPISRT